ncbi:hypothetical protein EES39_26470 [Streptomyces sp. ADI92-24]|uniref:hypothetical protein n=1 Tax=Streptomyces sp. ADI92-24 TaxID=1522756 RepID=UPI000F54E34F|nr:hypothetical protein [Streptomyces sp. ADI92-24]RPK39592.1 hypothetical protein EES39_26470 [Streptomyces sp. ADI92-24]
MDPAGTGVERGIEFPNGAGPPGRAPVPLMPGRWTVRAVRAEADEPASSGLVQLLRADGRIPEQQRR